MTSIIGKTMLYPIQICSKFDRFIETAKSLRLFPSSRFPIRECTLHAHDDQNRNHKRLDHLFNILFSLLLNFD